MSSWGRSAIDGFLLARTPLSISWGQPRMAEFPGKHSCEVRCGATGPGKSFFSFEDVLFRTMGWSPLSSPSSFVAQLVQVCIFGRVSAATQSPEDPTPTDLQTPKTRRVSQPKLEILETAQPTHVTLNPKP